MDDETEFQTGIDCPGYDGINRVKGNNYWRRDDEY